MQDMMVGIICIQDGLVFQILWDVVFENDKQECA